MSGMKPMKTATDGSVKTVWILALLLFVIYPSSAFSQNIITSGDGALIDKQMYNALQDRYKGGLRHVQPEGSANSFLQLLVTFEKQQLPNVIVVINTLNRSRDEITGKVLSNIIQLQVFPQIDAVELEARQSVMSAAMEWQYFRAVPQAVYLTPDNHIVYGWDLPVYQDTELAIETVGHVVDELAASWVELAPFLQERVLGMDSFGVSGNSVSINEPLATYSIVETLMMFAGGRGMTPESKLAFESFVKRAQAEKQKKIIVRGYVASDVDSEENKLLSRKRAERVVQLLVEEGVAASRIYAVGMGVENPLTSNETKEGRNQNRRAELLLED